MEYKVYPVENIFKTGLEQLGARPKFWFIDTAGKEFLFKESRIHSGEDWAEKIACEICRLLKIPHAEYELASYQGKRGVITPNFVPKTGRLVLANELLGRIIENYSPGIKFKQTQHTIERALLLIKFGEFLPPPSFETDEIIQSGYDIFPGYLMLDAFVANQDRHHENWGIVADSNKGVYLAPTFDHGSSLARNETDEARSERMTTRDKNRTIEVFSKRALSGFYGSLSSTRPMATIDTLKVAKKRNPPATDEWIRRLRELDNGEIEHLVNMVPGSVMTEIQKKFTCKLLFANKERILGL